MLDASSPVIPPVKSCIFILTIGNKRFQLQTKFFKVYINGILQGYHKKRLYFLISTRYALSESVYKTVSCQHWDIHLLKCSIKMPSARSFIHVSA